MKIENATIKRLSLYGFGALAVAGMFTLQSCSNDEPGPNPSEGEEQVQMEGDALKAKDGSQLSKYVTNYGLPRGTRALGDAMPENVSIPTDAVELSDINYGWTNVQNGVLCKNNTDEPLPTNIKVTKDTQWLNNPQGHGQSIYVASDATLTIETINGSWGDINDKNLTIYVMPGGKLVGNNGTIKFTNNCVGTIYNYQKNGVVGTGNDLNVYSSEFFTAEPINIAGTLNFEDCHVTTWGKIHANKYNMNGGNLYAHCAIIADESFYITSAGSGALSYVKTNDFKISQTGMVSTIRIFDGGIIDAKTFNVTNANEVRYYAAEGDKALIKAETMCGHQKDLTSAFNNLYLDYEKEAGTDELPLIYNANCVVNEDYVTTAVEGEDVCAPVIFGSPNTPDDGDDEPITPITVVSEINPAHDDHNHDISATSINLAGNNVFVSWHLRGTGIHGCLEGFSMAKDAEDNWTATLNSWVETKVGQGGSGIPEDTPGDIVVGNNDPDSYDFNHVIFDATDGGLYTVGDAGKKGGFVGFVPATGADITASIQARAMMIEKVDATTEKSNALSGNSIVKSGNEFFIATAGGYQYVNLAAGTSLFSITSEYYKNGNLKKSYFTNSLRNGDATTWVSTSGSAKFIALNGDKLATFEYTERAEKDGTDYWFNDSESVLPGKISVWSKANWIENVKAGTPEWSADVPAFGPVYGKNMVALGSDGTVYSAQGFAGLAIYQNGKEVKRWKFEDNAPRKIVANYLNGEKKNTAACNGLAVDNDFIYLAYGGAGLWILDKESLEIVTYYIYAGGRSCNYVAVDDSNDLIYLAYGRSGLRVLSLNREVAVSRNK